MEINNGRKRNGINQPPWKANGRYTYQIQLEKVYHNYSGKKRKFLQRCCMYKKLNI